MQDALMLLLLLALNKRDSHKQGKHTVAAQALRGSNQECQLVLHVSPDN